jgi:hypothetical protein
MAGTPGGGADVNDGADADVVFAAYTPRSWPDGRGVTDELEEDVQ